MAFLRLVSILGAVATIPAIQAALGIDVSQPITRGTWGCLKTNGSKFAIVRLYLPTGRPDKHGPTSIKHAVTLGWHVEGYIYPCYPCDMPRCQVQATVKNMRKHNVTVERVWVNVLPPNSDRFHWNHDAEPNVALVREVVHELVSQGFSVGIHTRATAWHEIMGDSTYFSSFPLWYAQWDNSRQWDMKAGIGPEYVPFEGWSKPHTKQYKHDTACNVGVGRNLRP